MCAKMEWIKPSMKFFVVKTNQIFVLVLNKQYYEKIEYI